MVSLTRFNTANVAADDRETYWKRAISSHFGALEIRRDEAGSGFHGDCVGLDLGTIRIARVASAPHEVVRTQRAVSQSRNTNFMVEIPLRGCAELEQSGRRATIRPGDFALCDNGRPFRYGYASTFDALVIDIARDTLLARSPAFECATALAVRGESEVGRFVSPLLTGLGDIPSLARSPVAVALLRGALDLIGTALLCEVQAPPQTPERVRYLAEAESYALGHLGDFDLTPARIAEAVGISERYLHALFHKDGRAVCRWVKQARLDRARTLLADPDSRDLTITEIGGAVGFKDAAHFSRAFTGAYGLAPRAFRTQSRAVSAAATALAPD